ncbi:MAG: iron-sulfur cluster assembly protein [Aliidongia sp.]
MARISEQQILEALKRIPDPDKGENIVDLGMISGLVVRDGHVGFSIEVEPARGPHLEPLRKAAERAVEALDGVLSVSAVLTATRPAGRPAPQRGPRAGPWSRPRPGRRSRA